MASTSLQASALDAYQVYAPGDYKAGFVFDKFLNDHVHCVDLKYEITTADRTVQHPGFESVLTQGSTFGRQMRFQLLDNTIRTVYQDIYILYTAIGLNTLHVGPYQLEVTCNRDMELLLDETEMNYNATFAWD